MFHNIYRNSIKLLLARIFAFICILLFSPVMLLVVILIKMDSPGKILFIQKRIGKDGIEFNIYKFRTMKENSSKEGTGAYTYEKDPRITRVGAVLRKMSLDELPQLFNILAGKMCFIGPRPLLPDIPLPYKDYPIEYKSRFSVLPGLFCLVDSIYRAKAAFEIQCKMDVEYVNNITFLMDAKIFFKTFRMVILRKGIY